MRNKESTLENYDKLFKCTFYGAGSFGWYLCDITPKKGVSITAVVSAIRKRFPSAKLRVKDRWDFKSIEQDAIADRLIREPNNSIVIQISAHDR